MSEKVQERASEMKPDFKKALDAVKDKRKVISEINDRIDGCRRNLQSYHDKETELLAEIEELEVKFTESLSSDQDSHAIHQKKLEAGQSVERYQEMITELERKVIPQLEKDLREAREDAHRAFNLEVMILRSNYQDRLDELVQDTIVAELLAWRMAYSEMVRGLEFQPVIPTPILRIKSREVEKALL